MPDYADRGSAPNPVADLTYPPGIPRAALPAGKVSALASASPHRPPAASSSARRRHRRRRSRALHAAEQGPTVAHVASLSCVVVGDPTTPLVVAGSALRRTGLFLTTGPRGASLRDRYQRARGRLTSTELREGRQSARRSLAATAYLDSPQARQIKGNWCEHPTMRRAISRARRISDGVIGRPG